MTGSAFAQELVGQPTPGALGFQPAATRIMERVNDFHNYLLWFIVPISIFVLGLLAVIYGVFNLQWYINELSAVFLIVALGCGLVSRMSATAMSETVQKGVALAAPGAFMVWPWLLQVHLWWVLQPPSRF